LQSLAPTVVRARVVGYGPFSLCVIHKDSVYPSSGSGDINRLMMMLMTKAWSRALSGIK
jgi:hypothetical protein